MGFTKVLLLGNGLNRAFGGISWGGLLNRINMSDFDTKYLKCPMPLQAILVTGDHIKQAMKENQDSFFGEVKTDELRLVLRNLLSAGFTDILTTNYSYELEIAPTEATATNKNKLIKNSRNSIPRERIEPKYLLHSFQSVSYKGTDNRVWHIHGEARKPDSMILGHYYYANLLQRIMGHVNGRQTDYRVNPAECTIKSWVDSFILGDVYILGFGMDYSEIDLWWLLNRKKREKGEHGKVFFYTAENEPEKEKLLELLNVQVVRAKVDKPTDEEEKNRYYKEFYRESIAEIIGRVNTQL